MSKVSEEVQMPSLPSQTSANARSRQREEASDLRQVRHNIPQQTSAASSRNCPHRSCKLSKVVDDRQFNVFFLSDHSFATSKDAKGHSTNGTTSGSICECISDRTLSNATFPDVQWPSDCKKNCCVTVKLIQRSRNSLRHNFTTV